MSEKVTKMKIFKPFTPDYDKTKGWSDYWYNIMKNLAEINWKEVDLKEKYWRMDASYSWYNICLEETMDDYEAMSECSCMYCNRYTGTKKVLMGQYWTHENSWMIHLCLPCLIGDKITILLEKTIKLWRKLIGHIGWA